MERTYVSTVSDPATILSPTLCNLLEQLTIVVTQTLGTRKFDVHTKVLNENGNSILFRRFAVDNNATFAMIRVARSEVTLWYWKNAGFKRLTLGFFEYLTVCASRTDFKIGVMSHVMAYISQKMSSA